MVKRRRPQRKSLITPLAWLVFLCISSVADGAGAARHQATPLLSSKVSKPSLSLSSTTSKPTALALPFTSKVARSPPWLQGVKNSVASSLAAATSKIILAPFDTIKTLQQNVRTSDLQTSVSLIEAARIITSRPRGFWELYAGLGVAVVGSMPSVGLYFGVYSYCKQRFQQMAASSSWIQQQDARWVKMCTVALSAAIGNTLASASRVPYEVLKQKLQTNVYRSTSEAIWHLAKTGGVRAFFPPGAIAIQTMRDVPYAVVTLLSYEYLRQSTLSSLLPWSKTGSATNSTFTTTTPPRKRNRLEYNDLLWGGLAGGLGSWVTNPLDVIKTRIQTSPEDYSGVDGSILRRCFQMTWQEGGIPAFFRGSVPRLLHKVPANALFFVFYEFFRRLMHVQDDEEEDGIANTKASHHLKPPRGTSPKLPPRRHI